MTSVRIFSGFARLCFAGRVDNRWTGSGGRAIPLEPAPQGDETGVVPVEHALCHAIISNYTCKSIEQRRITGWCPCMSQEWNENFTHTLPGGFDRPSRRFAAKIMTIQAAKNLGNPGAIVPSTKSRMCRQELGPTRNWLTLLVL
jgi:hypothetical protein